MLRIDKLFNIHLPDGVFILHRDAQGFRAIGVLSLGLDFCPKKNCEYTCLVWSDTFQCDTTINPATEPSISHDLHMRLSDVMPASLKHTPSNFIPANRCRITYQDLRNGLHLTQIQSSANPFSFQLDNDVTHCFVEVINGTATRSPLQLCPVALGDMRLHDLIHEHCMKLPPLQSQRVPELA